MSWLMHCYVLLCDDVIACEIKSGAIYPATFSDRGPDEDIRAAGLMVQRTVRHLASTYTVMCLLSQI